MLKTEALLEVKREDRIYTLSLPNNVHLGEVHDVLHEMLNFVIVKINEASKAVKPAEEISETPKSE